MALMTITSFMTGIKNWVLGKIGAITDLIPSQASSSNKLADKAFVNSSIATATATFQGTYNVVSDLSLSYNATHAQIQTALGSAISTADNNDYAFVQIPTADATPTQIAKIEKYKYNGTAWAFEYELNNSGFTAAQWAAINSGATLELIGKLSALPTNAELTELLAAKQNVIQDLATIRSGATAGATAVQPATLNTALSDTVAESGVYDVTANNDNAKFESLSALLSSKNLDTLIPTAKRKGGMSIKFVLTSDNKYVQCRYMGTATTGSPNPFLDTANWQGVDDEPTAGSENLVKSGGVDRQINGINRFNQSNYLNGRIYISTRKWSNVGDANHFACVVFQINNGGTLNVTANDTAAAQFAVLNTFTETEIQNGATPDIRIIEEIQVGTTKYYQVNSGEYLYFYIGYNAAYNRTPQSVLLNGEDIMVIGGLSKRVDSLEDAVITIGSSVDSKLDKEFTGKNIFDKTNIEEGYYFNGFGAKEATTYPLFVTVQPMPVKSDTDYFINVSNPSCYMVWLDANKTVILAQKYNNTYYRSPLDAAFLAFSGNISVLDIIQIEEGTKGTSYEPYTKIDAEKDIPKIYNKVFRDNFLSPKLYATLTSASSGDSLTILNAPDIVNGYSIGFNCIVGELGEIIIERNGGAYNVGKVIINDTNIVEYKPDNTTITTAHGLTISSVLAVNIYPYKSLVLVDNRKVLSALLVITTNSGKFTKEIFWVGRWSNVNVSFTSGTYTGAVLSFGGDWVNQDVWIFADSYGDMWFPYTFEREYKNRIVLSNHSGGGSGDELLVLKNMLRYAKPKKILWMLGMNELDSSEGIVNANWKSSLDEVISICNGNEIELNLYTVPNTPTRRNTAKNEVVRNSGLPYLDAAKFFGAEEAGSTWYQGLLSTDNVHPSVIGREYFTTLLASYIPEIVS